MSKRNWKRTAKSWRETALRYKKQLNAARGCLTDREDDVNHWATLADVRLKGWDAANKQAGEAILERFAAEEARDKWCSVANDRLEEWRRAEQQRDDACRWSAAWKQAAKAERRERLMYTRQDAKLDYAHFEPGNLQAMLEHPVFQVISQTMWEMLEAAPAPNYIEWQMRPRDEQGDGHDIVLTAQRCEGKTPHTCRKEAEAALVAANERVATLEGLLKEVTRYNPVEGTLLHQLRGRIWAALGDPRGSEGVVLREEPAPTPCETCGWAPNECVRLSMGCRDTSQVCNEWQAKPAPIDTREVDVMEWEGADA